MTFSIQGAHILQNRLPLVPADILKDLTKTIF